MHDLEELYEAADFGEPEAGTQGMPDLMVRASVVPGPRAGCCAR